MKTKILITGGLIFLTSICSYPWGQKGHDTVAYIAENHLTAATRSAVDSLLEGKSIVYFSNWLDQASHTPEYAYSKTWHYKNIDADQTFDSAPLLDSGDIVRAIEEQTKILSSPDSDLQEKQLALKMIVHFLGDIHQPMHLGHASDLGGNRHFVKYFGKDSNLHSIWDSSLPESAHKWSFTEWQQQIDRLTPNQMEVILEKTTPSSWAEETFEIAKNVYDSTPEGTKISYDYIAEWTPVIEQQFLRGGIRLADLLNSIFDCNYRSVISSEVIE